MGYKFAWTRFIVVMCMLFLLFSSAVADQSGIVSKKINWYLSDDGILTISGSGKMPSYESDPRPWENEYVKEVVIEKGIKGISYCTFSRINSLKKVTIADTVTEMQAWNFTDCINLEEILLPKNITVIDGDMFSGCYRLNTITIPERVTEISWQAFHNCSSLSELVLPPSLKTIRYGAFDGCSSLKKIVIPDKVVEIESNTFRNCRRLSKIILPKSLKRIDEGAFYGCESLTDVYFLGTKAEWNKIQIRENNQDLTYPGVHFLGTWDMADWEEEEEGQFDP